MIHPLPRQPGRQQRALRAEAERVPAQIVERLGMSLSELERIRDGLTQLLAASNAGQ